MKELILILIILIAVALLWGTIHLKQASGGAKCRNKYGQDWVLKAGLYDNGYCTNQITGEIRGAL